MSVKIYIRPFGDEFQVETVEDEKVHKASLHSDYTRAIIKVATLVMGYKQRDIQPQIYNELKTHVQVD